jgi:putative ABC transport system permease protein
VFTIDWVQTKETAMIRLENVSKYYTSLSTVGVGIRRVSLELSVGEFVVVTGPSGSGKSTLLNVISGLDTYEEGEMFVHGEETSHFTVDDWENHRSAMIGFIFQDYNVIDSLTVLDNVMVALELRGLDKKTCRKKAMALIDRVGLSARANHKAGKLSGGEKQRTVIARALAKESPVIVCDEPTGNLDSVTGKDIMNLLKEVSSDRLVVVVTHNEEDVRDHMTRRIRMRDGAVIEDVSLKDVPKADKEVMPDRTSPMPATTMVRQSVRQIIRTPRKFLFMASLQVIAVFLLLVAYAFLMASSDTLIGENAAESDSSHQMRLVRRDGQTLSEGDFLGFDPVRDIISLTTTYDAFVAFSLPGERDPLSNFPLGAIRMENAAVLDFEDLEEGDMPDEGGVVLPAIMLDLYGLEIGDDLLFFDRHMRFDNSVGIPYEIQGSTIRGTKETVYFNSAVFRDSALALQGMINVHGRVAYHYTMEDGELTANTFGFGQVLFSDQVPEGTVEVPVHLLPDPMESPVYAFDFVFGPYMGEDHLFHVESDAVFQSDAMHSNIIFSGSYRETLIGIFFPDDHESADLIINVRDITDGRTLSAMIDQETYRVFYDVNTASTATRIMTEGEFGALALAATAMLGAAVFAVLGAVMKSLGRDRLKDFSIMRAMGAHRHDLARSVMVGSIITSSVAYVTTIVLTLGAILVSHQVALAMRHVPLSAYVWLFLVVLSLSAWIASRHNRTFFGWSVITALNRNGDDDL